MNTPEKVAQICRERGITQKRVEELAALPKNRISKWLDGQGEPTARQALRLARVLGVPLDWLVDDGTDLPVPSAGLGPAEQRAAEIVRALDLSIEEVIRLLYGREESAAPTPGAARLLRSRDRTGTLDGLGCEDDPLEQDHAR